MTEGQSGIIFQRLEKKMLNNCEVSMDSSTLLRSGRNDNFDDFMVRESTLHKFLKELVTPVSLAALPSRG